MALGLLFLTTGSARAQVESGPKPGESPARFDAYVTTGENPDRSVDVLKETSGHPVVIVFVQKALWTRPVARYLKNLDTALENGVEGAEGASAVAVWLTDEPEASKAYQPRAQMSLMLSRTLFSVYEGSPLGPKGWALYDGVPLTAVVLRSGKVLKSVAFDPVDKPDPDEVVKALKSK